VAEPGTGGDRQIGGAARFGPLLRNRSFRSYFLSLASGESGYSVYAVAVIWLALKISGSAEFTGVVVGLEFGIYALSFAVAPFVDRVANLRTILLIGFPLQGVLAVVLGLLAEGGRLTPEILLALVAAISLLWDFTWTALNATLPRIVAPDDLFAANGLSGAVSGGNQIAGFAVGAALLLFVGPAFGMLLYGAFNFLGAILAIPLQARLVRPPSTGFRSELSEGWQYIATTRSPPMRMLVLFSAAQGIVSGTAPVLVALVADRRFPDPLPAYAILFTAFAVGGVVGSLLLGTVSPRRSVGWVLAGSAALEGVLLLGAMEAAPSLGPSIAAWFAVGFVDVAFYTALLVLLQATTPTALIGRTLGNMYLFRGSARAAGAAFIGVAVAAFSLLPVGAGLAVVFVVVGVGVVGAVPALRRLAF
jgi:hypothetical protein